MSHSSMTALDMIGFILFMLNPIWSKSLLVSSNNVGYRITLLSKDSAQIMEENLSILLF